MPHGRPSMPPPDIPLSALPPVPLPTDSPVTIENNVTYPFRLRHSYGQAQQHTTRPHYTSDSGPPCTLANAASAFDDENGADDGVITRPPPAVHASPARLSYASLGSSTNLSRRSPSSPCSADFPIIPSRPPLRPTVSFGGVSQISYYSNLSSDAELEARSVSLARAEEESLQGGMGSKWSTASLSEISLRKVRSFGCMWPEARQRGRS